tara:strand:+ start:36 stop:602 length:567 start_codon:yes stop_codon:yes gene_type:complete
MIQIKKKLKNTSRGFTMIEILVVLAALAIFGMLTAEILSNATKVYSNSLNKQKFISEARSSFFKIIREISWQKNAMSLSGSTNKKINITTLDGNIITYEIRSSNDIINSNQQISGSNNQILTNKIDYSNSQFSYFDEQGNIVNIQNQFNNVQSIKLEIKYINGNHNITLKSSVIPYGVLIGRPMSYHE